MRLPPLLASEVSSRIIAATPELRQLFAMPSTEFSGEDLEAMMSAIYLCGFGEGLLKGVDGDEQDVIVKWALEQTGLTKGAT